MKKFVTMTNILAELGDLNRNVKIYVNPAAAGPKKKSNRIVPTFTLSSEVVNDSTPKAYIKITIIQRGNW